ncbi:MAG: AAA family ATPase [Saprospiraceae bacterium]|nr:AAA family ATPase [Saprospiraceae bacterium]
MDKLQNLPIGQQYLASIRRGNSIYVDKTEYIYNLCQPADRYYFLSRPRRFGKSLTLDTINELFEGNRALFEGLWIEDKWDWSKTNPVIRLSFDSIGHKDGLANALLAALNKVAISFNLSLTSSHIGVAFEELIEKTVQKYGEQVVILIDEYDKPITEYIDPNDLTKAREQRDILREFFGVLKHTSKYIRFLLITGVSKFSKVSIFSELNHLTDLTLDPESAALCGYTQAELEHYFAPYIERMPPDTLGKMKFWYDGYSWDAETLMYNPYSVLNFFRVKRYRNFWYETGTPTFLVKVMRARFEYRLEQTEVSDLILESFNLEKFDQSDITSLLLQTGYLTIVEMTDDNTFILDYPNEEVKRAFGQFLLSHYTETPKMATHGTDILRALRSNDIGKAIAVINSLIQAVPDHNYIKNEEKFFHAIIHLIFTIIGSDVRSEVHTPIGRIDTLVVTSSRIFLFEFKLNESAADAIQCIEDRHYAESLRHRNLPITAVGVSFSPKTKGVAEWAQKEL